MLGHQTQAPYTRGGWIDRGGARERTKEIVDDFDVRTPSVDVSAYALSGGNQQKLIVGSGDARRAQAAHRLAPDARHRRRRPGRRVGEHPRGPRGRAWRCCFVSADLEELIGLSDTLLVIFRGSIVATLDPATVTPVDLGSYMTGRQGGERRLTPDASRSSSLWPRRSRPSCCRSSSRRSCCGRAATTRSTRSRRCGHYIDSTESVVDDHQPGGALLRVGARGRDRVQDEPVQHRRRGPVPAGGVAGGRSRRSGDVPRAVPGELHHAGRSRRRRGMGRDRRSPQGVARGQRGDLDDHAQLHRHRPHRVPAHQLPSCDERSGRPRHQDQAAAARVVHPSAQPLPRGVRPPPAGRS